VQVERFLTRRLQDCALATSNKYLRTLAAAFGRAVRRGYLKVNPAAGVRQIREPEQQIRILTVKETGKLLASCRSQTWCSLIVLALTTGMRFGELRALRWRDVNFEAGVVRVRNTPDHVTNSKRERPVALLPEAAQVLAKLPRRGDSVFTTDAGQLLHGNPREFHHTVKQAGVERCTLHDLRRTFVSQLAMAGVSKAVASGSRGMRTSRRR
jgi:integrase